MSLGSPAMPGAGHRGVLKQLIETAPNLTALTDAMKRMQKQAKKKQQEEDELPFLTHRQIRNAKGFDFIRTLCTLLQDIFTCSQTHCTPYFECYT